MREPVLGALLEDVLHHLDLAVPVHARRRFSEEQPWALRGLLPFHHGAPLVHAEGIPRPLHEGERGSMFERAFDPRGRHRQGDGPSIPWPLLRVLREHPRDQRIEPRRHRGDEIPEPRGLLVEDPGDDVQETRPLERGLPGQAFEDDRAQGKDVRPRVDRVSAPRLLGGHVPGGPDEEPRVRQPRVPRAFRDSEVEELQSLDSPAFEEQVARLDVPMHDAPRVQGAERFGRGSQQSKTLHEAERATLEPAREVLSLQPLHHEPRLSRRQIPRAT